MKYTQTAFSDLLIIKNKSFNDDRGSLKKFFYSDFFIQFNFKVDDIYTTKSNKNTIRGVHHQVAPYGQAKLVTCLSGSFLDIAVDLRQGSRTYGKVFTYKLVAGSDDQLLIPAGFSHGTLSLEDNTTMLSICSGKYLPEHESGINMKSIDLPYDTSMSSISAKDIALPDLKSML
uniref:dTDP-4-dehydrorhamnose 3,5-epimerase family protein n=1 Tax=Flavobacterium sp. TaxID=239 RepID=UPI004047CD6A